MDNSMTAPIPISDDERLTKAEQHSRDTLLMWRAWGDQFGLRLFGCDDERSATFVLTDGFFVVKDEAKALIDARFASLEAKLDTARADAMEEAAKIFDAPHLPGCSESGCDDDCPNADPAAAIRARADLAKEKKQ